MHRDRRKASLQIAALGMSPRRLVLFVCLLGVGMFSLVAPAAPASGASPSAKAGQAAPAPGDFVGGEACATCHEEVSKGFESNPHSKLAEAHGKTGVTCEGCHGPGKAHVDGGGDVTKIFNPAKASPKEVDEKCLTCHLGTADKFVDHELIAAGHPDLAFELDTFGSAQPARLPAHSLPAQSTRRNRF